MARYFLEVAYKGTAYNGFQVQDNAVTVQGEVEKALLVLLRKPIQLTGSSRTDSGVHALQNFFHFDENEIAEAVLLNQSKFLYKLNAILPKDIACNNIFKVKDDAHSRFDASSREYKYYICAHKNPFQQDRSYYYPFKINIDQLQEAAALLMLFTDFTSFSKRNTQVKTYNCIITNSQWSIENDLLVYQVQANRFLRGMVRGLVGTMLKAGRGKISIDQFRGIIENKDCSNADFSTPPQGLFLVSVNYPYPLLQQ